MQPTVLTLPGILLFTLTVLVIFAFKNPKGYKKIQNTLINIITLVFGAILGILIYKSYLLSKLSDQAINDSVITYLFSFEGDLVFYTVGTFLLFVGVLMLERIHTLNDKS